MPLAPGAPELSKRRLVAIFSVVGMALLMSSLDGTIVATALRAIHTGLHASINWTGWTITGYSAGMVMVLFLAGKLSERWGRRRFFLISAIVFTVASLCCGLATNVYELIALRVIQAAGGAGFTPSATGIVVENFGTARDKAVGLFGSIFPIGSMSGPIFGGLFVAHWTWRGIFFVNVPIGALLVVLCIRYVPPDRPRRAEDRKPIDALGMVLIGMGVLALMIATSDLGEHRAQITSPQVWCVGLVAVALLTWFFRHIHRVADPFIPPRLITGRTFGAVNAINALYAGGAGGLLALVPLYAVDRYHISALGSGTLLTAESGAVIVTATLAAMALRRTGYRRPLYVGFAFVAVGIVALAFRPPGFSAYAWLTIATCLCGIGTGVASPAARNAGLQLAPDSSSSIAALRTTGINIGSILFVSVATAILARASNVGSAQSTIYLVAGLLLCACLPVISGIPEHRGSW